MVDGVRCWRCCCGVFVKTTRRRRGDKVYGCLSLVESVRDGAEVGHRTFLRLGEVTAVRESGRLERIVATLGSHLRKERVGVGALAAEGVPAVGAVAAVAAVRRRLGLDGWLRGVGDQRGAAALEHAVFAMVADRLSAPCSKRRLTEWAAADAVMPGWWSAPSAGQCCRALDAVRRGRRRHRDAPVHEAARFDGSGPGAGVL